MRGNHINPDHSGNPIDICCFQCNKIAYLTSLTLVYKSRGGKQCAILMIETT